MGIILVGCRWQLTFKAIMNLYIMFIRFCATL
uniref:Uncharacterized protein n=1 Tax=Anguilla anguilla TaxID=7936 RepID=A0A0E9U721_ANGAN